MPTRLTIPLVLVFALARGVAAQQPAPAAAAPCDYRTCALGIAPAWDGLAVVRGVAGPRVANLGFFWPRDVGAALAGDDPRVAGADSAAAQARNALELRRVGAALTDGGAMLVALAAIGALRARHFRRDDGWVAGAGLAALGVSVPFQFAADGALSRAVWWHNVRYTH